MVVSELIMYSHLQITSLVTTVCASITLYKPLDLQGLCRIGQPINRIIVEDLHVQTGVTCTITLAVNITSVALQVLRVTTIRKPTILDVCFISKNNDNNIMKLEVMVMVSFI